jgi:hypothetical protein
MAPMPLVKASWSFETNCLCVSKRLAPEPHFAICVPKLVMDALTRPSDVVAAAAVATVDVPVTVVIAPPSDKSAPSTVITLPPLESPSEVAALIAAAPLVIFWPSKLELAMMLVT